MHRASHRYWIAKTAHSKDLLYELMQNGATLILNRLDLKCPDVSLLNLLVGQFVGEQTVANGYASFGGSGAFGRHWDTHDVFALQLIGRKKWTIFEPTLQWPLADQKSRNRRDECPAAPVLETVLETGDAIYIPRGWWHTTDSMDGQDTFHIAVGVHPARMLDYASWVCGQVMPSHLSSRRSVKWEASDIDVEAFIQTFGQEMKDPANLQTFKHLRAMQSRHEARFAFDRLAAQPSADSTLQVLLSSPYSQSCDTGHLISNGVSMRLDEVSRTALTRALHSPENSRSESTQTNSERKLLTKLVLNDVVTCWR